jgi:transaldolase
MFSAAMFSLILISVFTGFEMVFGFSSIAPSALFLASSRSHSKGTCLQASSQLEQLAAMTTLSIDSGDLKVIEEYAKTGFITDATTNPFFVSQVGLNSDDPIYAELVNDAVDFATSSLEGGDAVEIVALAIDKLSVNLGAAISKIVRGYISTEVDPRLSFDTQASVERARRIIHLYGQMGVPRSRVLIKLAATWEGICAAEILEAEGIKCNLTLVFSFLQAVACAQKGAHLISPFPGRILDWFNKDQPSRNGKVSAPEEDEGVVACKKMFNYFKVRCFCHVMNTMLHHKLLSVFPHYSISLFYMYVHRCVHIPVPWA